MIKRDERINPNSCFNRARDDEWLFVLLERDLASIAAIKTWIRERIRLGLNLSTDDQITSAQVWIDSVFREQKRIGLIPPGLSHGQIKSILDYEQDMDAEVVPQIIQEVKHRRALAEEARQRVM